MQVRLNDGKTSPVCFEETSMFVLLLFCGYVITWYLQVGYRIEALGSIRFEFIYAAFLTAIAFFQKNKFKCDNKIFLSVILLFLSMLVQIPFSYNVKLSYDVFVDRVLKFSFMAFFIVSFVRQPKHLAFFIGAFLLACMKMGQEGFVGQITGSMVWESQGVMRLNGSTPLYGHPNSFSGMALGTLPFIYFLFPLVNKYIKFLFIVQSIFVLNIIIHTGSRTGYVGFIVFLFIIILWGRSRIKMFFCVFAACLVFVSVVDRQYVERFETIFTMKEKEGKSAETRMQILEDAIEVFIENPLGVGVSAFPVVRMIKFGRHQDTHNLYLEVATNLGVQGFVVFFLFIFTMLSSLLRIINKLFLLKDSHKLDDSLMDDINFLEAVSKAVFSFVVIRLALGLFGMDLYEIYWWFSVGLTAALLNMVRAIDAKRNKNFATK